MEGCVDEEVLVGIGAGQQEADPTGVSQDHGADLEQFEPDRGGLGPLQLCALQTESPDGFEQHVRQTGEQQPELIGPPSVAAGSVGKEAELLLLDTVLHVAAGAVQLVVEGLAVALEVRS